MTIDGQTIQVSAGMTIYMPAGAEVSFVNGPDPLVAIQVFSGPEAAAAASGPEKTWIATKGSGPFTNETSAPAGI